MVDNQLLAVELSDLERQMLRSGVNEWGGPARPTEHLAVAMGFAGVKGMEADCQRLRVALADHEALSRADWRRVLILTEIVFASDVFGSGVEWPTTTGIPDEEAILLLRALQRKLPR